jgi:hypothetical protein
LATGELFCDSSDGSKPNVYAMIDLADGENRGRCSFPYNPNAQAQWEAEAPARKKTRAEKQVGHQKTYFGKMTTPHRKLFNRKKTAKARHAKTIKNIEDGTHTKHVMSLEDREDALEAAEAELCAYVQSTQVTQVTPAQAEAEAEAEAEVPPVSKKRKRTGTVWLASEFPEYSR